ncbi:MAG: hypothetical protein M1832_004092 [Thelocarpon impressellum]|nr:MAG: hypothetical protein M1832_004092 [Thelocarpon impressellum]
MSNAAKQQNSYDAVSPVDFTSPPQAVPYPGPDQKRPLDATRSRTSSNSSSSLSLKPPRTPRFAEATAVHSPIEPSREGRSPFADPPGAMASKPQPSDVGFGYIGENGSSRLATYPATPGDDGPKSPLKSALRTPGTPRRPMENPLSPTFKEEQMLEKVEEDTDKENARDLKVKIRVRLAKIVLRWTNFSCSLIVLAMLTSTFAIFNATKNLPKRNGLPAWSTKTSPTPQIVLLVIASVSLLFCLVIMYNHWKGKRHRAEKATVYYSVFAVFFFVFTIIMWAVGAGILNTSKQNGNGQDLWGWSCKDNDRKKLFQDDVSYDLVCRLQVSLSLLVRPTTADPSQNWSLVCCIIEVVVEVITICIYGVVFYRFRSKKKLRKSMDVRDKARSDLYLAQLRSQSAPNTPGFGPMSPMSPMSPAFKSDSMDPLSRAEEGSHSATTQFASSRGSVSRPKPFQLQAPPIRVHSASPSPAQDAFEVPSTPAPVHVPAAPGERTYESVPIPGAYASPLTSPTFAPATMSFQPLDQTPGQAVTTEQRVESARPGSQRR